MNTINYGTILLIALVLVLYLSVSNDDYQQAIIENQHWCDQISSGVWYSGQDEYQQRCG